MLTRSAQHLAKNAAPGDEARDEASTLKMGDDISMGYDPISAYTEGSERADPLLLIGMESKRVRMETRVEVPEGRPAETHQIYGGKVPEGKGRMRMEEC